MSSLRAFSCISVVTLAYASSFSLSPIFTNGITLQAGASPAARVWGWSDVGANVAVYLRGFNYTGGSWNHVPSLATIAKVNSSDGLWIAQLPPTEAGGVYRLEFYATEASGVTIANVTLDWVWFGDVFIASGQSNMGIPANYVLGPKNESSWAMMQTLNAYYSVRTLQIDEGAVAANPQTQVPPIGFQLGWGPLNNYTSNSFSALGAFTAAGFVDVAGQFVNDTVGVIEACWGGTSINIWMPAEATAVCPTTFPQTPATIDQGPSSPGSIDSTAFNSMIAPLTVGPLAIKGFWWMQGENNVGQGGAPYYSCALPALINSWRAAFGVPDAFFGIYQLAAYPSDNSSGLADIRDVQLNVSLAMNNVAIVSSTDLGDLYAPEGAIHPRYKVVNSRRMAAATALALYDVPSPPRGPTYLSAKALGTGPALAVQIAFEAATSEGLVLSAPSYPDDTGRLPTYNTAWPSILGSDGRWYNASYTLLDGNFTLSADAPGGVYAVATSYAYGNWPVNVLYNSAGQPAMPWKRWL